MRKTIFILTFVTGGVAGAAIACIAGFYGLFGVCRAISWLTQNNEFMFLMWMGIVVEPMMAIAGFTGGAAFATWCINRWIVSRRFQGFEVITKSDPPAARKDDRMHRIDTLEGILHSTIWYHYDVGSDVLYLRLVSKQHAHAVGEETDDGFVLLRDDETDEPVGLTIVNWWARFGQGDFPDSIRQIQEQIEPWSSKIAA
jgi:hypothetical protein